MNPEIRATQDTKNYYTSIGKEISSGKELDNSKLNDLFFIGLNYASNLVAEEGPKIFGFNEQNMEFKNYLGLAVLYRVIYFGKDAKEKGINHATSFTLMEELKNVYYEKLSVTEGSLPEGAIENIFSKFHKLFMNEDISVELESAMDLVGKFASKIVPENPEKN
jgi:hypothetical protein